MKLYTATVCICGDDTLASQDYPALPTSRQLVAFAKAVLMDTQKAGTVRNVEVLPLPPSRHREAVLQYAILVDGEPQDLYVMVDPEPIEG